MRLRLPLLSFALIGIICACAKRDPVANDLKPMNLALPANNISPDPAGGPPESGNEAAEVPASEPGFVIPSDLQGRWGLTPADCTLPLGRAKGLLIVSGSELRFYESRALPSKNVQTADGSINGDFKFTGEGQSWDKFEALQRNDDKLTRTETNPAASYTYAKC